PSDYVKDPRPTPPDEGAHVGYIDYLARQHALPPFRSQTDIYEAHQPPLYYLSSVPAHLLGITLDPEGKTGRGTLMLRLWSVLLAGLGVWIAWLLGRLVFGKDTLLSLAPALFLALWPGRTMIVSAVTNDALADSLCLLTFYLCLLIVSAGLTRRSALLVGTAWALALLTKSTSLALGPVVLLAILMRAVADDPEHQAAALKRALLNLLLAALPVVAIAGWWFVRNQMLYGDPLAAKIFEQLFSKDRATPDFFFKLGLSGGAYFTLVVVNTALSFWGVFGQANVYQPLGYYLTGFAVWAAALGGLVAQKLRDAQAVKHKGWHGPSSGHADAAPKRGPKSDRAATGKGTPSPATEVPDWRRQAWFLSCLLLVAVVVFFLRFNTTFYQAQARYLFAASGPIVLLLTLGLWDLHRARYGQWAVAVALLVMLAMSLSSVFGFAAVAAAHHPPPLFGG
ncbi:MAG: glycosyltransferase family 39 protein, partial [Armatimonadota bacterium]